MRFLVEVNALGKTDAKRYGIEADTWQKALQETRKLRGEDGPISGFSIELLDDGCRAVDPMARLRYVVKKGDAGLGLGALEDGKAMATRPPASAAATPAPTPTPGPAALAAKVVPATKVPAVAPVIPRAAPVPHHDATPAGPPASQRAPTSQRVPGSQRPGPVVPANRPSGAPAARVAPSAPPPPPPRDDRPPIKVLSRREQAPTANMPLYYREESILVAAGASEADIEATLRAHLASLQSELDARPRGKYVQIAAFDAPATSKKTRPLAVLSLKDWRSAEPTIAWPSRVQPTNSDAPTGIMSADVVGAYVAQSMPPNPAPAITPPAPPVAPPPAAAPAPAAAAAPAPVTAPIAAVQAAPHFPPPTPSAPYGVRPAAQSSGSFGPDGTRRRSFGDKRVPGEELIAQLFEEMHSLHFLNDALEGGHYCLAVAVDKLPSKGAYLHLYDIDRREFVIVCTRGQNTESLLLSRAGESDALLSAAMRKRSAVVVNDPASEPGIDAPRFAPLGGVKRAIVTPVMQAGRFLGAIELVNPIDGGPFSEIEGNAISYMAEQYAEFVAARGIVLEPERVSRASQAARA